jgi:hypothetical protein
MDESASLTVFVRVATMAASFAGGARDLDISRAHSYQAYMEATNNASADRVQGGLIFHRRASGFNQRLNVDNFIGGQTTISPSLNVGPILAAGTG